MKKESVGLKRQVRHWRHLWRWLFRVDCSFYALTDAHRQRWTMLTLPRRVSLSSVKLAWDVGYSVIWAGEHGLTRSPYYDSVRDELCLRLPVDPRSAHESVYLPSRISNTDQIGFVFIAIRSTHQEFHIACRFANDRRNVLVVSSITCFSLESKEQYPTRTCWLCMGTSLMAKITSPTCRRFDKAAGWFG